MTTYVATLSLEAPNANAAVQKLTTALYLGDLEAKTLSVKEENADGSLFDFPLTRQLIEELGERNG